MTDDHYARLGVDPRASDEEIVAAFRALAKQLHPDRVGADSQAAERFKGISESYSILTDPIQRAAYDERRQADASATRGMAGPNGPGGPTWNRSTARPPATRRVDPVANAQRSRRFMIGGLVSVLVGALAATMVLRLQAEDRDLQAGRVDARAVVVDQGPPLRVAVPTPSGTLTAALTDREGRGVAPLGKVLEVRYLEADPSDVISAESHLARDLTLWIVVIKLTVGGVLLVALGRRRERRRMPAPVSV